MTGPAPAVAACRSAVRAATADLPDDALVLVACSGGQDSLALAAAAAFVARGKGARLRAGAVVVDHGLLDGSADVAEQVARTCRGLGLDPVLVVPVLVDGPGGPEAAARDARYAALEDAVRRTGAAVVLVGHTLDDQAETVLLGLARGSGARSLAGMPAVRGVVRRPLLGLRRTDTAAACAAEGLEPWHDPTNAGAPGDPLRSRVRAEVLPVLDRVLGPGVPQALARTAEQLAEDAAALDDLAARLLADLGDEPGCTALAAAPTAVRRRALRSFAVRAGAPAGSLHRVHVLALDALVTDWRGQGPVALPGGLAARRACGRLVVGPAGRPDTADEE
ncbi:tRNA lysidine(34) synthetase TilS [Cellulomonas sp. HZM]|uniref:tRNA lysidine(34) synthetase TilS n=1 Tax=Cellulomonas sp. HZM TaxID=1454010 RepID=UPI000492F703|nr:tRNA lysidine(34) synthetase TilS [Cellulomonas sp. HZM]